MNDHHKTWNFVTDNDRPMLIDPRQSARNFPFTLTQVILNTSDPRIADGDDIVCNPNLEHIEQRQTLKLELSKEKCEEIHINYLIEAQRRDFSVEEARESMRTNRIGFW